MGELIASAGTVSTELEVKRPKFEDVWAAYSEVGYKNYAEVYDLIGGNVAKLRAESPDSYTNACALRMSRGFNYGGYLIPAGTIIPGTNIYRARGEDGHAYIVRVTGIINFIQHNWGEPDLDLLPSAIDQLQGKKGILVIEVDGWSDATGHAAIWNGSITGDGTDYQVVGGVSYHGNTNAKPTRVLYWELK